MKKAYFFLLFLIFPMCIFQAQAQTSDTLNQEVVTEIAADADQDSTLVGTAEINGSGQDSSGFPIEFWHALIILIFGVLIIGIEVYLIIKERIKTQDVMKYIIVTLIITCVMYLITAGHNNDQIAPAIGLLGTIAGYLLGKGGKEKKTTESTETPA